MELSRLSKAKAAQVFGAKPARLNRAERILKAWLAGFEKSGRLWGTKQAERFKSGVIGRKQRLFRGFS